MWGDHDCHCEHCCFCPNFDPDVFLFQAGESVSELFDQYRDFRSGQKAINRERKQSQKYYGYRGVKPSWIGQKFYTLVVLPTEETEINSHSDLHPRSRQSNIAVRRPKYLSQFENENEIQQPRELRDLYPNTIWTSIYHNNYVSLGASEACANDSLDCVPQTLTLLNDDLADPLNYWNGDSSDRSFPKIMPNTTVALATRTWTKQDNFAMKEFGIWPLDRRHHRGKKHREKKSMKEFGAKERRRKHRIHHTDYEELIGQDRGWRGYGPCCERCQLQDDIDMHMTAEVQTPEEYEAARQLVIEELKPQRLAEGDEVWELFYGPRAPPYAPIMDLQEWYLQYRQHKALAKKEKQEQKSEQAEESANGVAVDNSESDDDAWSGIIVASVASCGRQSSASMGEFDLVSELDSLHGDVEWEVLSLVGSTAGDESLT